ncbi:MAG TPA: molecular chaperone TorD family protein [Pyrinomonadaceae bacterium]
MELFRALAIFAEPPTLKAARVAETLGLGELPGADEYTEAFIFQLCPYASVYLGTEGMIGGEARDRVAGFWRALGQMPPAEPDHLALMLAFYARLVELEEEATDEQRRESWRGARKAFLWEHLLSWLPVYLTKLTGISSHFYAEWGMMLWRALVSEAMTIGDQQQLPLALREAPGLVDPRNDTMEEFLQSLVTPVRSGMILTRADLVKAASELQLGLRHGERKFILKALFAQDANGVFNWLIAETEDWARHHQGSKGGMFGEIARIWEQKTAAAAALLKELKLNASEVIS